MSSKDTQPAPSSLTWLQQRQQRDLYTDLTGSNAAEVILGIVSVISYSLGIGLFMSALFAVDTSQEDMKRYVGATLLLCIQPLAGMWSLVVLNGHYRAGIELAQTAIWVWLVAFFATVCGVFPYWKLCWLCNLVAWPAAKEQLSEAEQGLCETANGFVWLATGTSAALFMLVGPGLVASILVYLHRQLVIGCLRRRMEMARTFEQSRAACPKES